MTTVTLIGKSGCHLCEVAHDIVDRVLEDMPLDAAELVDVIDASIDDDDELRAVWWDKIPVVLIDDRFHSQWRIAPDAFRDALVAATSEELSA